MSHHEDSAGGLMTTEMITLQDCTVGEAIDQIKAKEEIAETIYSLYIVDEAKHLKGSVHFRTLLVEPPDRKIVDVMNDRPVAVHLNDSAKEVAFILEKYNLFAVPVVDENRVIEGIVTVDDILTLAVEEAWGEKSGLM